jgi:hypothetical protein
MHTGFFVKLGINILLSKQNLVINKCKCIIFREPYIVMPVTDAAGH